MQGSRAKCRLKLLDLHGVAFIFSGSPPTIARDCKGKAWQCEMHRSSGAALPLLGANPHNPWLRTSSPVGARLCSVGLDFDLI